MIASLTKLSLALSLSRTLTHTNVARHMKGSSSLPPIHQEPSANPPSSDPSSVTPNLSTLQTRHAWRARVYLVTFLSHWFCALFDLLSPLPQLVKRGNIIHQRPLWRGDHLLPTNRGTDQQTPAPMKTQMSCTQEERKALNLSQTIVLL